jgi:hypothetical protein
VNQDFRDLLRVFNEEKVRYLVVGGCALIKHSEPDVEKLRIAEIRDRKD